jgi:hypothetical protein
MKFGFLGTLFLVILVLVGGGVVWLAMTDLPVRQQEMTVDVPLNTQ